MAGKKNINEASVEELKRESGQLGDELANRIYNYIHDKGGIDSFEDLDKVSNIGKETIDTLKEGFIVK